MEEIYFKRIDILMEEYKMLNCEMLSNQASQRTMINIGLSAAAPIIAIVTYFKIENLLNNQLTMMAILYTVAFVYATMAIIYVGLIRGTLRISQYLNSILIPRINNITNGKNCLLQWELFLSYKIKKKPLELIGFSLHTGGELVSLLLPSVVSFALIWHFGSKWDLFHKGYLFNLLLLLLSFQYLIVTCYAVGTIIQALRICRILNKQK